MYNNRALRCVSHLIKEHTVDYVTFENASGKYISLHRADCGQLHKHGGTKHYVTHTTYADAVRYIEKLGRPVRVCSFCTPQPA